MSSKAYDKSNKVFSVGTGSLMQMKDITQQRVRGGMGKFHRITAENGLKLANLGRTSSAVCLFVAVVSVTLPLPSVCCVANHRRHCSCW